LKYNFILKYNGTFLYYHIWSI